MLRSLKGRLCHPLKMEIYYTIHSTSRNCLKRCENLKYMPGFTMQSSTVSSVEHRLVEILPEKKLSAGPLVRDSGVCFRYLEGNHSFRPRLGSLDGGRELKLDRGFALHAAAKACVSSLLPQDVQTAAETPRAVFYTNENDPAKHAEQHEGRLYSIALDELQTVFPHGLPYRFQQQVKTFNEARVMVRKPALELFAYLRNTNFAHPAVRYVIYGERGTGKTMTLCHLVHYCARQGWLVLHVPDAHLWVKNCRELLRSSYNKERLDQPLQASSWLKNFKTSNERFLKEIKTQKQYLWGRRDSTEAGRPLAEVVEQGLARVRNASDAVGVLLKELKQQSRLGSFRLLVAVDGVNALWGRTTLKKEDKSPVAPEELTLVHNLRKMLMNDWSGGAAVTTLSQTGALFKPSSAYLPQELLGKEGFDALDPFVPIPVPNYSPREFESCYQYYLQRKWLQHEKAHTEAGKEELRFLSGSNPRQLDRLAGPL